jgi:cytochrome c oxidase assembly protein subunit 15
MPVPQATATPALDGVRRAAVVAAVIVGFQIVLGGWTSSNYAAISCPDFPQCQAQWWPDGMDYGDAFVLWRGLDLGLINGVLVQGSAQAFRVLSGIASRAQVGFSGSYVWAIALGAVALIGIFTMRAGQ